MKLSLVRALSVLVLLLLSATPMTSRTDASGEPMDDPDITVHFHGLMVFDDCTSGDHPQLVRLHCDAQDHEVTIMFTGPGYPNPTKWGRVHPKAEDVRLEVWERNAPVSAIVSWPPQAQNSNDYSIPYPMRNRHPSGGLGRFMMTPGAFGPTFTLTTGSFSRETYTDIYFVSLVDSGNVYRVPAEVKATIDLSGDRVAVLSSDRLSPDVTPSQRAFRQPLPTERKWEIWVTNEPDADHLCGYHFLEYYKGFKFERGEVRPEQRYTAKPAVAGMDPCDQRVSAAEIKRYQNQMPQKPEEVFALETRPCIPISN